MQFFFIQCLGPLFFITICSFLPDKKTFRAIICLLHFPINHDMTDHCALAITMDHCVLVIKIDSNVPLLMQKRKFVGSKGSRDLSFENE